MKWTAPGPAKAGPYIRYLAVALVVLFSASGSTALRAQFSAPMAQGISAQVMAQIRALMAEKASRTRVQRKIDSQLLFAHRMTRRQAIASGVSTLAADVPRARDGRAIVDVHASVTGDLIQRLRAAGIGILSQDASMGALRLQARLDQIEEIAAYPEVVFVQPKQEAETRGFRRFDGPGSGVRGPEVQGSLPVTVLRPARRTMDRAALVAAIRRAIVGQGAITQVGSRQSEGDLTHAASAARTTYGVDGTGVKIGVLSDGVTNLVTAQASGDLGAVTVAPGQAGDGDEGTAMLEIIHDLAPGAQLFFATAFNGITSFANNIRTLRNTYGCDIIVDDVFYYVETSFQDGQASSVVAPNNGGVVIQAVKDVAAAGALYFSSAGNSGNKNDGTSGTWEGDFVDGGAVTFPEAGRIHSFGGQNYNVLTASGRVINLHWSDPLGGSANDYDLFMLNSAGTSVLAASDNYQSGTQDPYEAFASSSSFVNGRIVIVKYSGSDRFLHLSTNRGRLSISTGGEIHGHSATSATNSFGVAATPARSPGPSPNPFTSANTIETFSSDGPRRIFFNADGSAITPGNLSSTGGQLLTKPDLTAADGVVVSGAGGFPSEGCSPCVFYGTSAAAPHAAAIAALIKSADLSLSASQVRSALLASAIDIEAAGTDRDSGVGIVMADTGVQGVLSPLMAIDAPTPNSTQVQPFTFWGWAIDRRSTSGTGVDQVQVWATPSGGSEQFVNAATYGLSRSDVASTYGSRFGSSGFSISISGLAPGTYTLRAYAHSTVSNTFNQNAAVIVTIASSAPAMALDAPANGTTTGSSFTVLGWAIDRAATSGTGVDDVHVWAFPTGGGSAQFLGQATYGSARPDVGDVYGSQFSNSGYALAASGLAVGSYRIVAYAHSLVAGSFNQSQYADITIAADPRMAVDAPLTGSTGMRPFTTSGWAVDRGASSGTGVDVVHVWAVPAGGGAAVFVGAASYGGARSDIGGLYGSRFTNSGYSLSVTSTNLPAAGEYDLVIYARSTLTGSFNQRRVVRVIVQ